MAQNIIYSLWEETENPWLCLMGMFYYLVSFDCFPLFLYVLTHLWLGLFFGKSFSTDKSQAEDLGNKDP